MNSQRRSQNDRSSGKFILQGQEPTVKEHSCFQLIIYGKHKNKENYLHYCILFKFASLQNITS